MLCYWLRRRFWNKPTDPKLIYTLALGLEPRMLLNLNKLITSQEKVVVSKVIAMPPNKPKLDHQA